MNKSILALLVANIGTLISLNVHAAVVNNGDVLTVTSGIYQYNATGGVTGVSGGSYYGVDTNGDHAISDSEKTLLSQGTTGLVIGVSTSPGAYHSGAPTASDTNAITAPDYFFGNTGSWYSTTPITGDTVSGLNMSDWDWAWNTLSTTNLGGMAWQPTNCAALGCSGYTFLNGVGRFQWDGVYGHSYTLDTTSTIPPGDPSGIGGAQFYTHLEGIVTTVPIPSTAWLFASGMMGLASICRKRAGT